MSSSLWPKRWLSRDMQRYAEISGAQLAQLGSDLMLMSGIHSRVLK